MTLVLPSVQARGATTTGPNQIPSAKFFFCNTFSYVKRIVSWQDKKKKKMNCDTFFPPKMLNEFW